MIEIRSGHKLLKSTPNVWLAIKDAQSFAINRDAPIYLWDDGVPVATVYETGRVLITL